MATLYVGKNGIATTPKKIYVGVNGLSKAVQAIYTGVNGEAVKIYPQESGGGGIYGAEWDGSSVTTWTRTDDAANFPDPNPYYAGMSGTPSSPFDNISPWAGMVRVTDSAAGELVAIPKFYYKLEKVGTLGMKIQISATPQTGFVTSPAHMDRGDGVGERDVVYIGRYHCNSSNYKSQTDVLPKSAITRENARTAIHNLGSTIWQNDFAMRFTLWLLYIVEFANWNSQDMIGYGCGNNSSVGKMGYTDSMQYHTGTTQSSRTAYGLSTQYRYIEGLWDNVYDYLDGCYYNARQLNIILNPANFSDSSGGMTVGEVSNGYPSAFAVKDISRAFPMFIPTTSSGSDSTYSCDQWLFSGSSYPSIQCGGNYGNALTRGLFYVGCIKSTGSSPGVGSRLMKLP